MANVLNQHPRCLQAIIFFTFSTFADRCALQNHDLFPFEEKKRDMMCLPACQRMVTQHGSRLHSAKWRRPGQGSLFILTKVWFHDWGKNWKHCRHSWRVEVVITHRVLYWSTCWMIPFNCLKEITELNLNWSLHVNRFCANHSQLCSTFEIANSLPSSSPSTCFSPLLQTVFSCVLCILFPAVLSMNLILQATFAVMFLWEATEKMWTNFFCRSKRHQSYQQCSLHHGGMRQETSVAVLMVQLSGCTPTKWRTLNSTNLKNGETCRHLVIYDGLGNQNLKPKSSQTSRKRSEVKNLKSACRISTAMHVSFVQGPGSNLDTPQLPQVSPQVAQKPSIKDTIWIKLGDVSHFRNLEISWNLMEVPGLQLFDAFFQGL